MRIGQTIYLLMIWLILFSACGKEESSEFETAASGCISDSDCIGGVCDCEKNSVGGCLSGETGTCINGENDAKNDDDVKTCTPDCADKKCGPDGCGGICGTCGDGFSCKESTGECADNSCTPDCNGITCGNDDGCGGSCGCLDGKVCDDESDKCMDTCQTKGWICGSVNGEECGECGAGLACDENTGRCVDCVPNCDGINCGGDDKCGGTCGCFDGKACGDSGKCVDTCVTLSYECGEVNDEKCGPNNGGCLNNKRCDPAAGECIDSCASLGWECGSVNGEVCGQCSGANEVCDEINGVCNCTPNCDGKVCGDNGCGGSCGSCDPGFSCGSDNSCSETECTAIQVGSSLTLKNGVVDSTRNENYDLVYGVFTPNVGGIGDDEWQIKFYGTPPIGSYSLSSEVNKNSSTCEQCILVLEDIVSGYSTKTYFQLSGIFQVEEIEGKRKDTVTDLKLIEIGFGTNGESIPIENGSCITIDKFDWTYN